jgi:hypothetical protein
MNRVDKESTAKDIAELVELASYNNVGVAALCMSRIASSIGIPVKTIVAHLSTELLDDRDFIYSTERPYSHGCSVE